MVYYCRGDIVSTITKEYNNDELSRLEKKLIKATRRTTPPYALYSFKIESCVITAYTSGKVVFQGNDAAFYAENLLGETIVPSPSKNTSKIAFPMAGSDEVGTGDYFGPVVVVACSISAQLYEELKTYPIQDSKAMKDEVILEIVPSLLEQVPHSKLILLPKKYNEIHKQHNMNAIKALLHNQAYLHLQKKVNKPLENVIVDQFCTPTLYYKYLRNEKEIYRELHFETKAESKYFAVALASVFARYYFLVSWAQMSVKYDFPFLKGASSKVDEQIRRYVDLHGEDALYEIAKVHYANTQKALNQR